MFRKRYPVLTAGFCDKLEKIRLAVEIFTGHRVRFREFDFNTGKGEIIVGCVVKSILVVSFNLSTLEFDLGEGWVSAVFDSYGVVRVINIETPNKRRDGEVTMRWVGKSLADRREEPLHLESAQYAAGAQGLSLEEYLSA